MFLIGRFIYKSKSLLISRSRMMYKNFDDTAYFSGKVELPMPPKRPLTAYMLYLQEKRRELLKENPDLTSAELIKLLAEKWNQLPKESRKPFEELSRKGTLVYGDEHKKYFESLSEDQKELLTRLKAEKQESRRLKKFKKAIHESGLPKPPSSAYGLFVQSCAKKTENINQLGEFIKEVAKKWKSLPEETKKVFETQAQVEKSRYVSEMKQWEARLTKEGNGQLVKQYFENNPRARSATEDSPSPKLKPKKELKERKVKEKSPESRTTN